MESRHTSHFRVLVSSGVAAYPNWVNYLRVRLDRFASDLHVTNSHRTTTTSRRSSASAGTLAQYTSLVAAKQDKDAEFCSAFTNVFHVSSLVYICSILLGLVTSNSATFIRHFPHFACVFPRCASFLLFPSIPSLFQCRITLLFLSFARSLHFDETSSE